MDSNPVTSIRPWLVSVFALRWQDDAPQVLLLKRQATLVGCWCQVAGKIKPGERAWQAALRELGEETGLVPDRFYSADICEQFYEPERDEIVIAPVFVAFVSEDAEIVLNHEHSDFRWWGFDAARAHLPFAGQKRVLAQIKTEFADQPPNPHLRIALA